MELVGPERAVSCNNQVIPGLIALVPMTPFEAVGQGMFAQSLSLPTPQLRSFGWAAPRYLPMRSHRARRSRFARSGRSPAYSGTPSTLLAARTNTVESNGL